MDLPLDLLRSRVDTHPRSLLFATISGAHLYGFPSADSDFDLRGVHLCPVAEVVGLHEPLDTIEIDNKATMVADGIEFDIVSHDAKKFFSLMLRKNGYVLEQLYSPLVIKTGPLHDELKAIGKNCITRHHSHHYLGFAETQWRLFEKERPRRVKPLLYTYRVLLTGIHLMRAGVVEANLLTLNEEAKLPYVSELVARELAGAERSVLEEADFAFHEAEMMRLRGELEKAHAESTLPEEASARGALHDLLVRLRLGANAAPHG